ncbi:TetR/AcrR family transcriptional regulator [Leucobacter iarius]|uniref:HTH tetR-type domain-containing protein n=1 Tax=Leucobacter iarius TaxID=333963 RepID=A0ABN2LVL5_9MICO
MASEQGSPGSEPTPRKRGRPTGAERAQRRDDIIDAAVRLFVERGFARVTFDDLREEARVTKRTIYADFADRSEVFLAAVERLRDRALAAPAEHHGLPEAAATIVFALHSDEAIGLHRLVIAEARTFPGLAERFYADGPAAYIAALRQRMPDRSVDRAEALFALLLGEPHRKRLLGLTSAPTRAEAESQALAAIAALGLR